MHAIIQLLYLLLFYGVVEWRQESMAEREGMWWEWDQDRNKQLLKVLSHCTTTPQLWHLFIKMIKTDGSSTRNSHLEEQFPPKEEQQNAALVMRNCFFCLKKLWWIWSFTFKFMHFAEDFIQSNL